MTVADDTSAAPTDQLVEALSGRLLAAGTSLRGTLAVSATLARWAADHDVPADALTDLVKRLTPTEGANP
ncbi:MAG TPA: hypothetical protein VFI09_08140 [Solirubrobacterales bacterium]|nr:hypothetical protein [Solirubrobacterales bacterium]